MDKEEVIVAYGTKNRFSIKKMKKNKGYAFAEGAKEMAKHIAETDVYVFPRDIDDVHRNAMRELDFEFKNKFGQTVKEYFGRE